MEKARGIQFLDSIGFSASRPGAWTIDILDGVLPAGSHSIFTIHPITDEHIIRAHPTPAAIVLEDQRTRVSRTEDGRSGYREEWVKSARYLEVVMELAKSMGSGIVNAHRIVSPASGEVSVGIYISSCFFPETIATDKRVIPEVRKELGARIRAAQKRRGFLIDEANGIIGLGAQTGTREHTRYFLSQPGRYTNGNTLTGGATAISIGETLEAIRQRTGRNPRVLVVGATGATGMTTTALLAQGRPVHLVLCSRTMGDLNELAARLTTRSFGTEVSICLSSALRSELATADVVIYLTSDPSLMINPDWYRPGTVVIDVARPRCHPVDFPERRPDLIITDGPTMLIPGEVYDETLFDLDVNEVLCCMAETACHAVARDWQHLTPPLRVHEFTQLPLVAATKRVLGLAESHGISLAPWHRWHGQKLYPHTLVSERVA